MTEPSTLRVLLAMHDDESRRELRRILEESGGIDVVHEAASGAELARILHGERPHDCDVALVDLGLHDPSAFDVLGRLSSNGDRPRVVAMSRYNDSRYVARALHAGAAGYLLTDRAYEELAGAVRAVSAGRHFVSPGVAGIKAEE